MAHNAGTQANREESADEHSADTSHPSPPVRVAGEALRACGHDPVYISSGGGSDANALIAQGFATVNIANGTERNHEPGERVSMVALEEMLDVALALLDAAAGLAPAAAL